LGEGGREGTGRKAGKSGFWPRCSAAPPRVCVCACAGGRLSVQTGVGRSPGSWGEGGRGVGWGGRGVVFSQLLKILCEVLPPGPVGGTRALLQKHRGVPGKEGRGSCCSALASAAAELENTRRRRRSHHNCRSEFGPCQSNCPLEVLVCPWALVPGPLPTYQLPARFYVWFACHGASWWVCRMPVLVLVLQAQGGPQVQVKGCSCRARSGARWRCAASSSAQCV
jgi:hypothetical protein